MKQEAWGIKELFIALVLRFVLTILVARIILSIFPFPGDTVFTVVDRFFMVTVVLYIVYKYFPSGKNHLGLKWSLTGKNILTGIAAGIGFMIIANVGEQVLNLFLQDVAVHPLVKMARESNSFIAFTIPLLLGGVITPVAEEIFYRGFAYSAFKKHTGKIAAVLLAAIFFTLLHLTPMWFGEIFLVGVGLTVLFEYTGSLVPGIIAHSFINSFRLLMAFLS